MNEAREAAAESSSQNRTQGEAAVRGQLAGDRVGERDSPALASFPNSLPPFPLPFRRSRSCDTMMRSRTPTVAGLLRRGARCFSRGWSSSPPLMPQRRVVVTGLGLVTPLGAGVQASWDKLIALKTGVQALSAENLRLKNPGFLQQLPSRVAAIVPRGSAPGDFDVEKWQKPAEPGFIAYAQCAAEEALTDANWHPQEVADLERTGVAIGGGIGSINDILEASHLINKQELRRLSPFFVPRILINMAAGHVSIRHGFKGPNHAVVTACASGAHSVGDAARMIKFGDADVMVAGGTESSIDPLSMAGFCRARALSTKFNNDPAISSRPFDQARDGFVMGEGAGVVVLEELQHALDRGAKIYAEVRGYGMSGDAHHITQPSQEGRGAYLAMNRALQQAGLQPDDVDYINAHATSTPLGDVVEARAIRDVFKDHAHSGRLVFSSTKGATGHLLGAAGAVEAIFAVLALHHGVAPPTLNLERPDAIFDGHFSPLSAPKTMNIKAVLTNSFGFGGTNAALVITAPSES